MLTAARFQNLGLFRESFKLPYKKKQERVSVPPRGILGVHVGHNGSGKSSVAEFYRRCVSSDINYSDTFIPDRSKRAGCVTKYEATPRSLKTFKPLNEEECAIIEGFLGFNLQDPSDDTIEITAGIVYMENNGLRVRVVEFEKGNSVVAAVERTNCNAQNKYDPSTKRYLKHMGHVLTDEFEINESVLDNTTDDQDAESAKAVYSCLFGSQGLVSFIFPHRGIGPMDSSRSVKMSRDDKDQNYIEPVRRAETLVNLIREIKKEGLEGKLKQNFHDVTGTDAYEFNLNPEEDRLVIDDKHTGSVIDLLKSPEGIYEAFLSCAVITNAKEYTTIFFDEPNRCMHPVMVKKLNHLFVRTVQEKSLSIIISTHAPEFVSPETWQNLYFFRRTSPGEVDNPNIQLTCKRVEGEEMKRINQFTLPHLRQILFARKVLLVEGKTDDFLINQLLREMQIRNNSFTLSDIEVVSTRGCGLAGPVGHLLRKLGIPYRTLLDTDNSHALLVSLVEKELLVTNGNVKISLSQLLASLKSRKKTIKDVRHGIRQLFNHSKLKLGTETRIEFEHQYCSSIKSKKSEIREVIVTPLKALEAEIAPESGLQEVIKTFRAFDTLPWPPYTCKIEDITFLFDAERLLSIDTSQDSPAGDQPAGTYRWRYGNLEDVVTCSLRRVVQQNKQPVIQNENTCVWYCTKDSPGAVDQLSLDNLETIAQMLLDDKENKDIEDFMECIQEFADS